jgi:hypothetical protein
MEGGFHLSMEVGPYPDPDSPKRRLPDPDLMNVFLSEKLVYTIMSYRGLT